MRFRLRTLLICISLLGVICAAAGWTWRRNSAERKAVQTLALHQARFDYSDGLRFGGMEEWLDTRLGREFRADVSAVHLDNFEANDPEVVSALRRLPGLKRVNVACWPGKVAAGEKLRTDLSDRAVEVQIEHVTW